MSTMMMVALSGINQALLHLIRNKLPNSLTELAGHLVQNLSHAANDGRLQFGGAEKKKMREINLVTLTISFRILID